MDAGSALPAVLLTVALLLVNAFFVAAEFAIVRVRRTQLTQIADAGSGRARLAVRISDRLEDYLSTVQVGVTGASLGIGIIGEPAIGSLIRPLFVWLTAISDVLFRAVSFIVTFGLITYATLVLSELAPKYIALQHALPLALWTSYPLHFAYRILFPFVWAVNRGAGALVRMIGVAPRAELDAHSEEELKMLVAVSTRQGILQESERELLGNALDFADTIVRQVMVPRTEMVALPDDLPFDGIMAMARQHPFTRFPVFREDLDHVVGVVHVRDLVGAADDGRTAREIMRGVPVLPETTRLDQALAHFRRERVQLAIVVDEFGGTAGLVTLEDVIEQLVGEVQDEFDREAPAFRQEAPDTFVIDGLLPLDDLRERLAMELPDDPYDTVGGFVFGRLGRVASVGDAVDVDGFRFHVTGVDGRRIAQVRAERRQPHGV